MLPNRYPTYSLTLPIANQKVKYRPYTVPEETKILTAMESKDSAVTPLS